MNQNGSESQRYLYANRNNVDIGEAFINDAKALAEMWQADHDISPLDDMVMNMAQMDIIIGDYLHTWDSGKKVPNLAKTAVMDKLRIDESSVVVLNLNNRRFVQEKGADPVLDSLALAGAAKVSSGLYSRWNPYIIESWIRRGASSAMLPAYRELLAHRSMPVGSPSHKTVNESMIRLALTSQVLREVRDRIIDDPRLLAGQKSYFKSLDGLFAEYDALLNLYETVTPDVPGESLWHFPAPPNMDLNPNGEVKADIVSVRFLKGEPVGFRLYDVKTKPIARHLKQLGQVTRLTLDDIGDVYVEGGEKKRQAGHLCDDFLKDYASTFPDERIINSDKKVAFAASVLGIYLRGMQDFVDNHRNQETLSA